MEGRPPPPLPAEDVVVPDRLGEAAGRRTAEVERERVPRSAAELAEMLDALRGRVSFRSGSGRSARAIKQSRAMRMSPHNTYRRQTHRSSPKFCGSWMVWAWW